MRTGGDVVGTPWSPWRMVVGFGTVSLAGDMVYEGMRSIAGPFLGSLGASALTVGLVTGAGEAAALLLRLVSGPIADRTRRHWMLTLLGYGLTAVCVPLLALAPALGVAGLAVASALIITERIGKAIRSPSKSALLADAAREVGRGTGFAVHKALDQVGAFAGPLVVAGVVALAGGAVWPAFAVLAVPGAVAMALLVQLRRRHADRATDDPGPGTIAPEEATRLPGRFYAVALAAGLSTLGLMTFGVISFHLVETGLLTTAMVPLAYAGAMAVAAVAALVSGRVYDRVGGRVLYLLPLLVAAVPALTLSSALGSVVVGLALWAAATGVQDSTVKALVADLVPRFRLATAYGVFAAFQGVAALAGGALAGALYANDRDRLVIGVAVAQVVALVLLVAALRSRSGGIDGRS